MTKLHQEFTRDTNYQYLHSSIQWDLHPCTKIVVPFYLAPEAPNQAYLLSAGLRRF